MSQAGPVPTKPSAVSFNEDWRGDLPAFAFSAVIVTALAANRGGYFPTAWGWGSLFAGWVAVTCLVIPQQVRVSRIGFIWVSGILALLVWTAASILWSSDVTQSAYAVERELLYITVPASCLLLARRPKPSSLVGGALVGVVATCCIALAIHLFPDYLGVAIAPGGGGRLYLPLGYWNATGVFAAIGILLALGFAADGPNSAVRAISGAAIPVLGLAMFLTYSRGSFAAFGAGFVVAVALDSKRLRTLCIAVGLLPWSLALILVANRARDVTGSTYGLNAAVEGHRVGLIAILLALGAGGTTAVLHRLGTHVVVSRRARSLFVGFLVTFAISTPVAALVARHESPLAVGDRVYSGLTSQPPRARSDQRLLSLSLNGRGALWGVAWEEFARHPVLGSGAGTYEQYWDRNRTYGANARWSHSLELGFLAELGLPGAGLLVFVLVVPGVAAVKSRRTGLVPCTGGACAAYIIHSATDWDWQVPALTVTALICFAAIVASMRTGGGSRTSSRGRQVAVPVVLALMVVAFVGLKGNEALANSEAASQLDRWDLAISAAHDAKEWAPWSYEPDSAAAYALLHRGDPGAAAAAYRSAIATGGQDRWDVWFGLARSTVGRQRSEAVATALRLNPLSQELRLFCDEHPELRCPGE